MTGSRPYGVRARSPQGSGSLLPFLVAAVLYGLLSMHGLGPGVTAGGHAAHGAGHSAAKAAPAHSAAPASASGPSSGIAHPAARLMASAPVAPGPPSTSSHVRTALPHDFRPLPERQHADECECGGTDGHAAHADPTCAASGVSGAPAMDATAAGAAVGPHPATGLEGRCSDSGGERAPPSLHSLQLLRI